MVLIGMFIGGAIPFLIASITMTAVGDAAFDMINEIRRQFLERYRVCLRAMPNRIRPVALISPRPPHCDAWSCPGQSPYSRPLSWA